jgi:hypothetical protein
MMQVQADRSLTPDEVARLRVYLLAEGLVVSSDAQDHLTSAAKPALRVRSGSCGGLDLVLPGKRYVNCPIHEHFVSASPFTLTFDREQLFIHDARQRFSDVPAWPVPTPDFYGRLASDGTPLQRTGQLCSDRLGIGLTNICRYYRSPTSRCKFCSIGQNVIYERANKTLETISETVDAAYADSVAPARHLLLGGGTPEGPDAGAIAIAETARMIKRRWSQPIYAMLTPPSDFQYIDLLYESGVDEIGMNVELFSDEAARRYIPGKRAANPLMAYFAALEHAVSLFGPMHTRSITVVGLESATETVKGVAELACRGVMPILSPLRPLKGTALERKRRWSASALWDLTRRAAEAADRYDMPLGPTCVACQSNTLTPSWHSEYRFY